MMLRDGKRVDTRRIVLHRKGGKFRLAKRHHRRGDCEVLRSFKLERPVFGGRGDGPLRFAYRLSVPARVSVKVLRGSRVVKRFRAKNRAAARTYRLKVPAGVRGNYRVRLTAVSGSQRVTATLTARHL